MGVGGRRYPDDLAAKGFREIPELRFGIQDQDIVIGGQGDAHDLLFGAERLAAAGNAQPEAVAVEELAPVGHNHVFAHGVLTIVDAAVLHDLLGTERNEHSSAFCGQGAQCGDPSQAVGQHSVKAVLLLPAEDTHLAQMLAGDREKALGVAVQLFLGVRQMHHGHEAEKHPLVTVSQVAQHLLRLGSLLLNVIG